MFARSMLPLLLLAASAGAQENKLWYTPGAAKYKVTTNATNSQEFQGQKQEFTASSEQIVSVSIGKPSRDSLPLTIVLDTISQTTNAPQAPDVARLVGMKLDGLMSPQGKVYSASIKNRDGSEALAQQAEALRRFLPRLPASIRNGMTWTDTVDSKLPLPNGIELNRHSVITYTVNGDTTVSGQKAWRVNMESKSKVTGKGSQGGADFTIDGGAAGTGTTFVAPSGWFLGMDASENQELVVTVTAAGMIIPITTTTRTRVERIS